MLSFCFALFFAFSSSLCLHITISIALPRSQAHTHTLTLTHGQVGALSLCSRAAFAFCLLMRIQMDSVVFRLEARILSPVGVLASTQRFPRHCFSLSDTSTVELIARRLRNYATNEFYAEMDLCRCSHGFCSTFVYVIAVVLSPDSSILLLRFDTYLIRRSIICLLYT